MTHEALPLPLTFFLRDTLAVGFVFLVYLTLLPKPKNPAKDETVLEQLEGIALKTNIIELGKEDAGGEDG